MTRKAATKNITSEPLPAPQVAPIDVDAWVAEQGVQLIEDVQKVLGEISAASPKGEDVDEFLDDICRSCRGRPYRSKAPSSPH